jgi:single-strand DNA-binding protein
MQVCSFSIATNRVYKDKEGNKKEQADFHNIVVFGRQAETCGQYLKKGQTAMVEGRIQTRSWDDKDGQKKYRTEIVADRVQFGPKAGGGQGYATRTDADPTQTDSDKGKKPGKEAANGIEYPTEEINPEDIPF